MRRSLLVTLLLVATGAPAAPPPRASAKPRLPVQSFQLKNGLRVFVSEDHTVPLVAVDLWYHVGSRDEKPGRTGFAHLFEHLMFKGSRNVADGQHFQVISEAGGTGNATTNRDRTNFFAVVPSNFVERVLWLESDRMISLADAMTQQKLDNQRDVVRNERRQNYENRPYGIAPKLVAEALYPEGHPYRWLTIGEHRDLEAATLDDVTSFFRAWYTPANASLALVGDITLAQARRLVERYFGEATSRPVPARPKVAPVRLTEEKRVVGRDRVTLERLQLVWPSPPAFAPGDAELDLLASILAAKSGRLHRKLVYELQVAQSVEVLQASMKLGSEFTIAATARPGHTAAELEKLILEELGHLLTDRPVERAELERARNGWEASFVYGLEEVGGFSGRADRLNAYYHALGRPDGLNLDLGRYLKATADGVTEVAREVLGPGRVALTILPAEKPAAAATSPTEKK